MRQFGGDRVVIQGENLSKEIEDALGGQALSLVLDPVGGEPMRLWQVRFGLAEWSSPTVTRAARHRSSHRASSSSADFNSTASGCPAGSAQYRSRRLSTCTRSLERSLRMARSPLNEEGHFFPFR